ncbi:Metallo-dependent phosphatase [Basidiobolus meristosporus CBS 931.73]|uniref:Metallo-dependent phosphatase n=1 Tax=Basidiobolus meristosporus CBS 931.73 TaxID=1314790 RepID=A0A1Y1YGB7_9FUNG|nr:Metallo-dependent phosphatase [Basidiobolus meristosporus CBS 931.73]|eukprot:ORX97080.1 Metallo-dependent phosphatase [Basidiobolus meristosporus CBS 931.73]
MRFLLAIYSIAILLVGVVSFPQNLFGISRKSGVGIDPSRETPAQIKELHLPNTTQRLIVIGDVHGSLDPLNKLLAKLDYDPRYDHLVLAGDIVGKGPKSIEVLQRAREINASCVRGNHDNLLLEWSQFLQLLSSAEAEGHSSPFPPDLKPKSPYYPLARKLKEEHLEYLKTCSLILSVPRYSLYVLHAGIDPSIPIERQDANVVMNVKNILPDGTPSRSNKLGKHWSVLWNMKQKAIGEASKTIIYGHQASRGLNIKPHSIGLDTGCVYGKQLTAMVFPGNKLFSVHCEKYHRKPLSFLPIFNDFI